MAFSISIDGRYYYINEMEMESATRNYCSGPVKYQAA